MLMHVKALLRKKLRHLRVDGILVTDLTNVRYLTGFTGSSGYVFITPKDAVFVTDFRYQEQAKHEVKGFKLITERRHRDEEIKGLVDGYGVKKLGFEDHSVTYGFYKKLVKKEIRLRSITGLVEDMRIVKSGREIDRIRKAVRRAETAFRKLQPFIKEGVTELKLAIKLEEFLKGEGCKSLPFGVIVASGFRSALPHARPTNKVIRAGDFIMFDWGGEYEGYYADMTRTVGLKGKNTAKQKEIYSVVLEAQKRAIGSVKSNMKAKAVDAAARDYIRAEGHGEEFGHGTGHGIGLAVHEKPYISWRSKDEIREDMVFTVEPGIYIPGFGGVRIEDMVVVTKAGSEVLTRLPKRFRII